MTKRWISIKTAAKLAGEPIWRMRQRLELLNHRSGGKILSTPHGRRGHGCKLWVDSTALLTELRAEHEEHDTDLARIRADLEGLRQGLENQRSAHRALRREVAENQKKQKAVNKANLAAIQAIEALAHIVADS